MYNPFLSFLTVFVKDSNTIRLFKLSQLNANWTFWRFSFVQLIKQKCPREKEKKGEELEASTGVFLIVDSSVFLLEKCEWGQYDQKGLLSTVGLTKNWWSYCTPSPRRTITVLVVPMTLIALDWRERVILHDLSKECDQRSDHLRIMLPVMADGVNNFWSSPKRVIAAFSG